MLFGTLSSWYGVVSGGQGKVPEHIEDRVKI